MVIARALEIELGPCLRKFGIVLAIYNPLAAGLFSGRYTALARPNEGRFSDTSGTGPMYRARYFKASVLKALAVIEPVAEVYGIPMVQVGLRWCVHHSILRLEDGKDALVLGFSSYDQLVQNVEACEAGPLPIAVIQKSRGIT